MNAGSEEIPEIATYALEAALQQMKNGRTHDKYKITSEMLKVGGDAVIHSLKILFSKCLDESRIPDDWRNAQVILLFKKGDNKNIEPFIALV